MSKEDFIPGQSNVQDFWKFINERHKIYLKRKDGCKRPWSDDPIFQEWKFTNVFRELDRGTIALRQMLKTLYDQYIQYTNLVTHPRSETYIRNQFITCILYRMFNWHENARYGPISNPTAWYKYLRNKKDNGDQIFTGAYMQPSVKGEDKLVTFERVCREIVSEADGLIESIRGYNYLEHAWSILQKYDCIGPFTAYEFVCDLRYTDILRNATDTCTWCNIGPGAERGLSRMDLATTLESIQNLYKESKNILWNGDDNHWIWDHTLKMPINIKYPYWELREIEHCLCEFDKYERIRLGQGRPRAKFNGRKE